MNSQSHEAFVMHELSSLNTVNNLDLYKHDSDGFFPLHKVALSLSPENLKSFLDLNNYDRFRINVTNNGKNSLHLVIEKITRENYEKAKECIKILIEHGCSMNMPNKNAETPFYILLKDVQEKLSIGHELVPWIMTKVKIDFYTYRGNEMRELFQRNNPSLPLPERDSTVVELSCGYMETLIRKQQENDFIAKFDDFIDNAVDYHDDDEHFILAEFLYEAIKSSCEEIIKFLIVCGADVNAKLHHYSIIESACHEGYPKILEILLKSKPKIENQEGCKNVLHILCEYFCFEPCADPKRSYKKCFEIMIDHCDKDVVNQKDEKGQTPLFHAAKYKFDDAVIALLKKGAYINAETKFDETPLDFMKPETLKAFLDECITEDNGIRIDYSFLMRKEICPKTKENTYEREILALENMKKHRDLRPLIAHPVLASFLHMKWSKLSISFHLNLAMYTLYFALLIPYIIKINDPSSNEETPALILWQVFLFLCTLLIALREFLQMTIAGFNYFANIINLLELLLISLSTILTLGKIFISDYFWNDTLVPLSVVTILLASLEFLLLIGTLPYLNVSTYMVTFGKVVMSFLKSMILCSIMIISFGLCFFLIFQKDANNDGNGEGRNETDCDESKRFSNIGISIIAMIAMLTGELELASLELEKRNQWVSLFFLLFVFLMTIVLFNLIQALAFDDTQKIRMEGEIIDLCEKIKVLSKYEVIAFSVTGHVFGMKKRIVLFPHMIPHGMIVIQPSENNAIYPYEPTEITDPCVNENVRENPSCARSFCNWKMDKSVMEKVHEILEKRKDSEANPERLCIIEADIKDVQAKLERIAYILEHNFRDTN